MIFEVKRLHLQVRSLILQVERLHLQIRTLILKVERLQLQARTLIFEVKRIHLQMRTLIPKVKRLNLGQELRSSSAKGWPHEVRASIVQVGSMIPEVRTLLQQDRSVSLSSKAQEKG